MAPEPVKDPTLADPASAPAPTGPSAPGPSTPGPSGPASDGPPRVAVGFVIRPVVGDAAPTLTVKIRNESAQAVPMTRFADVACFVRHYLRLEVTRPDGKPQALAGCASRDWPGVEEPLAAGGERAIEVPFAALAKKWPRGTYTLDLQWDPSELATVRGQAAAVAASQSSFNTLQFTVARPLATVRVERGASVTLPDGLRVQFTGHSHKHVGADETSPLIIYLEVTPPGARQAQPFSTNLHTEYTTLFVVDGGYTFELVEHAYDEWMKLRYFGRVAGQE